MTIPLSLSAPPVRGQSDHHPLVPAGLQAHPLATLRDGAAALWENRGALGHATRVLRHAVCDHCELGPRGLHDDTLPGRHLCLKRLQALRADTQGAFVPADVRDLRLLRLRSATGLQDLGRIPYPLVARAGDRGFTRLEWAEALELAGQALGGLAPERIGVLAGTRGLTNEALYAVVRSMRLLGVPHLDACVPPFVSASAEVLASLLGREASTCSVADAVGADLVLLCGTHTRRDQPALARVLRRARAGGTRVVALNAHTDLDQADDAFHVKSPAALLAAALWLLHDNQGLDADFLAAHVARHKPALKTLRATPLQAWLDAAGTRREHAEWLATLIGRAGSWVSFCGPDPAATQALVALHLGRGAIGRRHCGLVALGGGACFQGARDLGLTPVRLPGGATLTKTHAEALQKLWGHPVGHGAGLDATGQLAAAAVGELDALTLVAADPLSVLGATALPGLARVGLRLHLATHLDPSMLVDPAGTTLLLPLATPHEQQGGGTLTSVERRIRYTPRIDGRDAPGLARPAWQVPAQLVAAARPDLEGAFDGLDPAALRREMAQAVPDYAGLESLCRSGDWLQWGGPQLYREGTFPLPRAKARLPDLTPG